MKICIICKNSKHTLDFGKNKNSKDGLQAYCKQCSRDKDKKHYKTSIIRRRKIRQNNVNQTKKIKKTIFDFLKTHPCVDCGESNPLVLEFDHKENKILAIATMVQNKPSIKSILKEIEKCEIRCANCHRKKTAKEQNNWKLAFLI